MDLKVVATNRKARHEYLILDTYEAGLVLYGSEIKSIRAGQISLAQAYVSKDGQNVWLVNAQTGKSILNLSAQHSGSYGLPVFGK